MENKSKKCCLRPISTDYNYGNINGFSKVNILVEDGKAFISYYLSGMTYFEFKNAIVGAMGYMANQKDIFQLLRHYESVFECEQILEKRNPQNLLNDIKKNKVENSRILIAIKEGSAFPFVNKV